jgi:hypothetical protein
MLAKVCHNLSRFVAVGLALASLVAPAAAQSPSPAAVAAAKELLVLKGATSMFEPLLPGVVDRMRMVFLQQNPTLAKDLSEVATSLKTELAVRVAELQEEAAKVYASKFTEQELKEILAFYRTPLGKKVVEEDPKILDQTLAMADQWLKKLENEVLSKMRAQMKKKGHDL